jgi:predicted RND superfamily exporter protein
MIYSCIESYFIAFVLVGGLMFVLMGGIRKGLLALIPNIIPIFLTLGMMGWAGIPLNILTSLLGCVIIGISVDDTIHFMHHYQDKVSRGSTPKEAIVNSLRMSGRAIAFTSFVLISCFMVYAFDVFTTSIQFGVLLSFSILIALFANLMLAPALLQTFWKSES